MVQRTVINHRFQWVEKRPRQAHPEVKRLKGTTAKRNHIDAPMQYKKVVEQRSSLISRVQISLGNDQLCLGLVSISVSHSSCVTRTTVRAGETRWNQLKPSRIDPIGTTLTENGPGQSSRPAMWLAWIQERVAKQWQWISDGDLLLFRPTGRPGNHVTDGLAQCNLFLSFFRRMAAQYVPCFDNTLRSVPLPAIRPPLTIPIYSIRFHVKYRFQDGCFNDAKLVRSYGQVGFDPWGMGPAKIH
jgi:hypothetical protein